jgi:hypothetical protein
VSSVHKKNVATIQHQRLLVSDDKIPCVEVDRCSIMPLFNWNHFFVLFDNGGGRHLREQPISAVVLENVLMLVCVASGESLSD